ncbi:MAG TPA: nodulation protein NfeD [Candidatus Acidoferrum sp.]|nr:nodulation protein NfeD [Candidatus Acidoferrum sp.]
MNARHPFPSSGLLHRSKLRAFGFLCASCLILPALFFAPASADEHTGQPEVLQLTLHSEVEPVLATYIDEGLAAAASRHAALVLITMDTPGGLSDSMTDIIQHILASPVPVAVYVSPTGARGASAGFFILLSADIAAMAPGTHTGAASPVVAIGGWELQVDETMHKKILNDALAFLRSYAVKRGRNSALAETAVTEAKAFTDQEALDGKLVDMIAASPEDLVQKLDGRSITRFDGTKKVLALTNAVFVPFQLSSRQRFLARIVQPDVFFVLLLIAALGLYAEFTHPGFIAPGVIGGISAILALYAMHFLPVNFAGVLLILIALVFFILEAKFTSHGILALGGIISMLLGAMFLIRSPLTSGGVSLGVAVAVTLPFAVITIFLMRLVLKSRAWKTATGKEELIGVQGISIAPLAAGQEGMIRVHGELWRAISSVAVESGKPVRVRSIDGLKLHVEPETAPAVENK